MTKKLAKQLYLLNTQHCKRQIKLASSEYIKKTKLNVYMKNPFLKYTFVNKLEEIFSITWAYQIFP